MPVPLPPPLRILTDDEWDTALAAADDFIRSDSASRQAAEYAIGAALATLGLFRAPPRDPNSYYCSAQKLAWDAQKNRGYLGAWRQCAGKPGHGGTEHTTEDIGRDTWSDGVPGSVPARPADSWTA